MIIGGLPHFISHLTFLISQFLILIIIMTFRCLKLVDDMFPMRNAQCEMINVTFFLE
jgi:hypothetical protein